MANKYKLFGNPISPFSYLIHAALVYKQADFEFIFIDLTKAEQKETEFLKLNPFGLVPVLETNTGQAIYESSAIFQYLEEQFPEYSMLPQTEPQRSKSRSLAAVISGQIIPLGRELLMEAFGRLILTADDRQIKRQTLVEKLTLLEQELNILSGSSNLTGCDALLFQSWNNLKIAYPDIRTLLPKLNAYIEEVAQNPIICSIESSPIVKKVREILALRLAPRN